MNKTKFIEALSKRLNLDLETCRKIDEIFEKYFIISKSNKNKVITSLIEELKIDEETATRIYEEGTNLISETIKDKIKHPFKKYE